MIFFNPKRSKTPPSQNIQVFIRHAVYSSISAKKKRPLGFSRETCYQNLRNTIDSRVHLTHFLDTATPGDHFIKSEAIEIKEGTESGSFLRMLEHVSALDLEPNTIIYFLEDDYIHRPGWVDVLLEGFTTDADYVTLYDHGDKYTSYPKLKSKILVTPSTHWRTTPSTTNTYAMRFSTLLQDLPIHRRFSMDRKVTDDHNKFCLLGKKGAILISPIPGWSTHADPEFISPCIDWEHYFKENLCKHSH